MSVDVLGKVIFFDVENKEYTKASYSVVVWKCQIDLGQDDDGAVVDVVDGALVFMISSSARDFGGISCLQPPVSYHVGQLVLKSGELLSVPLWVRHTCGIVRICRLFAK